MYLDIGVIKLQLVMIYCVLLIGGVKRTEVVEALNNSKDRV